MVGALEGGAVEGREEDIAVEFGVHLGQHELGQAVLKAMADNPHAPPPGLNWDLYLGPAKEVAYHPAYHPFSWRGWVDFGVSAIGDMGAHLIDHGCGHGRDRPGEERSERRGGEGGHEGHQQEELSRKLEAKKGEEAR